jgi:alpha-L-rhamnosidase
MERYFAYLTGKAHDGILDYGLGEWGTLNPNVPTGFTATWAYYRDATLLAKIAGVLGKVDDAARYDAAAAQIAVAFNARFFDPARACAVPKLVVSSVSW